MAPSENTLTLHATHGLLSWLEPQVARTVAKSPSRIDEGDRSHGGYDVEHQVARAFHLQYKAPRRFRKTDFQLRDGSQSQGGPYSQFKLDLHQHVTLAFHNEAVQHGYFALPLVHDENTIPDALNETVFVNIYAVELGTKYLYVPRASNSNLTLYGRRYNGQFYEIDAGIYRWQDFQHFLTNNSYGFGIRDSSGFTDEYFERLARLLLAKHLFDPGWRGLQGRFATDGGKDEKEFRERFAQQLANHITTEQNRFTEIKEVSRDREQKRFREDDIVATLEDYENSNDPSLEGIRRSRQIIRETGTGVGSESLEDVTRDLVADKVQSQIDNML